MKPYPEYKDSGVPWLGKIPAHWDCYALKHACHLSALYGANIPASEYVDSGIRFLRTTDINDNGEVKSGGVFVNPSDVSGYILNDGDLLISRSGTIGRSLRYSMIHHGPCSYAGYLVRFVPKSIIFSDYLFYFTKSISFSDFTRIAAISSTIDNVNGDKFAKMSVISPPQEDQGAIVAFLQSMDRKISRFIRNKRRLIELLKEQKQAIINQAVTRGIDPNVKLKPSGIEWLGQIPEHWEVRRLRAIATVNPSNVDKKRFEDEVPVKLCNYVDVYKNELITDKIDFMKATATIEEIDKFKLKAGDVIITKDSEDWTDIAVPTYVPQTIEGVICGYHLAMIRPRSQDVNGEYLFRAFMAESIADQFRVSANGVTRYGLPQGAIKNAFFPLPPKDEQSEIVNTISEQCSGIDGAISRAEREIGLIREYRTRLISDVVTGKVDVRTVEVREDKSKVKAKRKPNKYFYRSVLAAEIIDNLHEEPTFGRYKLQKVIHLCEYHAQINEIESQPLRDAAGPHDNRMLRSIESQVRTQKWFKRVPRKSFGYMYIPMEKEGGHKDFFNRYWGDKKEIIHGLIEKLRPLDTDRCKMVSTLYAAWNDLIIAGDNISDDTILAEVLERWSEEKKDVPEERWRKALDWMRGEGLVPTGFGNPTKTKKNVGDISVESVSEDEDFNEGINSEIMNEDDTVPLEEDSE